MAGNSLKMVEDLALRGKPGMDTRRTLSALRWPWLLQTPDADDMYDAHLEKIKQIDTGAGVTRGLSMRRSMQNRHVSQGVYDEAADASGRRRCRGPASKSQQRQRRSWFCGPSAAERPSSEPTHVKCTCTRVSTLKFDLQAASHSSGSLLKSQDTLGSFNRPS